MKKILIIFFLLLSTYISGNQISTTDIYGSKIWFSKDTFFAGEKIRIYTEFNNNNSFDTIQTIVFLDNDKKIGEKKIEIVSKEKAIIWIDYQINPGKHNIITKIKELKKDTVFTKEEIKTPNISNLKSIDIDSDNDGDGIGDKIDDDDDNDGVSDIDEISAGSNPKSKFSTPSTKKIKNKITDFFDNINNTKNNLKKNIESRLQDNNTKVKIDNFLDPKYEEKITKLDNKKEFILGLGRYKNETNNITNKKEFLNWYKKNIKQIETNKTLSSSERIFLKAVLYKIKKEELIKYKIDEEKKLITKYKDRQNFDKIKDKISKEIFIENKDEILIKTEEKILELEKSNRLTESIKAAIYSIKYDKFEELNDWWNITKYWFLKIIYIILSSSFLTILIFIILAYWIWKKMR